eukprot:15447008-Alexandrium_andersonii.AAC.1
MAVSGTLDWPPILLPVGAVGFTRAQETLRLRQLEEAPSSKGCVAVRPVREYSPPPRVASVSPACRPRSRARVDAHHRSCRPTTCGFDDIRFRNNKLASR